MTTTNDLRADAVSLCLKLGVPMPSISLRNGLNSTYDPRLQEINVAREARRGVVPSFLHQLAHHVAACRGWGLWHDADFKECLQEIVGLTGQSYPWDTEKSDSMKAEAGEEI